MYFLKIDFTRLLKFSVILNIIFSINSCLCLFYLTDLIVCHDLIQTASVLPISDFFFFCFFHSTAIKHNPVFRSWSSGPWYSAEYLLKHNPHDVFFLFQFFLQRRFLGHKIVEKGVFYFPAQSVLINVKDQDI